MDCPISQCLGRKRVPGSKTRNEQLVIDYRYLNACLEEHELPLPVIGDLLQG